MAVMEIVETQRVDKAFHDADLVEWAAASAAKLCSGAVLAEAEREQIADELLDMARSTRRELRSRFTVLMTHLLKNEFQPEKRTRSWMGTIQQQRDEVRDLLSESPSLYRMLASDCENLYRRAVRQAQSETGLDCFPDRNPFTLEQILQD